MTEHPLLNPDAIDALGWAIADRVLAGTTTENDLAALRAWAATYPEAHDALRLLREAFVLSAPAPSIVRRSHAELYERAARARTEGASRGARTTDVSLVKSHSRRLFHRMPSWRRWAGIGATALGVATLWGLVFRPWLGRTTDTTHQYRALASTPTTVLLADGSRVTLAPHSVLTVAPSFGRMHRTVTLVGEGLFVVNATSRAPFLVMTGATTTRVLGTTFDVLHDDRTHRVRVAVVSGRVAFGVHAMTVLTPGIVGVARDSTTTVQTEVHPERFTAWVSGHLRFHDATVDEVLSTVGLWYGFQFQLQDSTMGKDLVTATFDYTDRADALVALKTLLKVRMTFDGNVVTLHPATPAYAAPRGKPWGPPSDGSRHSIEVGR